MRPDRLVVGECRGEEVRELLMALNTGHAGGAGTVHASGIRDLPTRLEALGAEGDKTLLDWKGAFYRAYPNNNPPADQNDEASAASVEAAHQKGIDALVERFGKAE